MIKKTLSLTKAFSSKLIVGGHYVGCNPVPSNTAGDYGIGAHILEAITSKTEQAGISFEIVSPNGLLGSQSSSIDGPGTNKQVCLSTGCPEITKTIKKEVEALGVDLPINSQIRCPWFPTKVTELDFTGKLIQEIAVNEVNPYTCHTDEEYKKNFEKLIQKSNTYKMGDPIPAANYTEEENNLWKYLYPQLRKGVKDYGTREFNMGFDKLEDARVFTRDKIPNLEEVNQFMQKEMNWRFKLAGGSIEQREFLNMQAFRASTCTQYIRHPSDPYFTPVPDIIHELCGHVPMLLDEDYANFNQQLGMLSLGATEYQLKRIAAVYWYTSEFGACYEDGIRKFFGAGQASSVKELQSYLAKEGTDIAYDIREDLPQDYTQEDLKPQFYISESYAAVIEQFKGLNDNVGKSFNLEYDEKSNSYKVDRIIFMEEKEVSNKIMVFN